MLLWVSRFCDARVAGQLRRIGKCIHPASINSKYRTPNFRTKPLLVCSFSFLLLTNNFFLLVLQGGFKIEIEDSK